MPLILQVADLHAVEWHYDWLVDEALTHPWDAIVIAGDLIDQFTTRRSLAEEAEMVTKKLCAIPERIALLICTGNHDQFGFLQDDFFPEWMGEIPERRPNTHVDGARVTLDGVSFEIVGWGQRPAGAADFYVSHAPPAGALTATEGGRTMGEDALSRHLWAHGGIALSGHVHAPLAWHDLRRGCRSFNPGYSDQQYPPSHITIDTEARTALRIGWELGESKISF